MNDLSWLIYLADVSGSFKSGLLAIIGTSFTAILMLLFAIFPMSDNDVTKESWKTWRRLMIGASSLFCTSILVYPFVPSKQTVYAIAASEMGEELLKTETVGKAHQALDNWLDEQLEEVTDSE